MENNLESGYLQRLSRAMKARGRPEEEIARCARYAEKLMSNGLPVLFDGAQVYQVLRWGKQSRQEYHVFSLVQKGKIREITAPSRMLKRRQRWILEHILQKLDVSDHAHGFVKDRSIKTHAALHASHGYALCMDIEDFFPSIREETVAQVFARAGYSRRAAAALADICCYLGTLPQGAPTSPGLANLVFRTGDEQLARLAAENGAIYSRYADDLTFSSDAPLQNLAGAVEQVLGQQGFRLNESKTKEFLPGRPKRITGLIVQNGTIRVPREFKRSLKQEIYYCKKFGVVLHLENTNAEKSVNYREYLYGKAYYVKMIEPEQGEQFLKELDSIQWPQWYC